MIVTNLISAPSLISTPTAQWMSLYNQLLL